MTVLHIPDDVLGQAGISEKEAVIELACRLYDTGRLTLFFAAKLADIPQPDFEELLLSKQIPVYRFSDSDLKNDLETLRRGGA